GGAAAPAAHLIAPGPPTAPATQPPPPPLTADQIRSTAARWVAAMWSRPAGRGPFAWLDQVADITSPDLLAELRSARATLDDQLTLSVTVDIDGVYPSAVDPATVTVTCVAHRRVAAGVVDQPCATTVTVGAAPDGHPTVTAVQ
ncbi:MAG: hypothetical protein M3083_18020, partial [Actinomycetota bacterium]|nr:hypothetical protein [Actinomycetota bacterium]